MKRCEHRSAIENLVSQKELICAATDKKLYWIEGTDQRFQGYNHFGREPQAMLEWLNGHMP